MGVSPTPSTTETRRHERARELLGKMSLAEKIGQLVLVNGAAGEIPADLREAIAAGRVGGVLNEVVPECVDELQRIACDESRLGIPLLIARDVIHGFKHIAPIPLGQAASWNPELVEACARLAAREAAASGVNWAMAPMVDIGRDPRWGRVAESFGEDPLLTSRFGAAVVRGLQGEDLSHADSVAACVKHFAGYGASEGGRDYDCTSVPEIELRQVHLPPFQACLQAGAVSLMPSFGDLNGTPATMNRLLLQRILRQEWGFEGIVLSDWEAVRQLVDHGVCADRREAAREAALAGVDMEMFSRCFEDHLPGLIAAGEVDVSRLDEMVLSILRVKLQLGLFDGRRRPLEVPLKQEELQPLYHSALQSVVLLKNESQTLPLQVEKLKKLAVIGPLADEALEQLGTWVFDGDTSLSVTPLQALREYAKGRFEVIHEPGLEYSRDRSLEGMPKATMAAIEADAVVVFLGEEAILSGEAHCRADLRLPGAQTELLRRVTDSGKPVIVVILAGRPLALQEVIDLPAAVLYAWHPGTLAGPALRDLLFGIESPSGKLPMTFPRMSGQVPVYYARKNTGRPASAEFYTPLEEIPRGAVQYSTGNTCHHLDAGYTPLFPFGFGLSYSTFSYDNLQLKTCRVSRDSAALDFSVCLRNTGKVEAEEVVQVYVRDLVGSVTRPVRELKDFRRVRLAAGESRVLHFSLPVKELAFVGADLGWRLEAGKHQLFVGGSSAAQLMNEFELL